MTSRGEEKLITYLTHEYPEAFEIVRFPGAETLVIKGTEKRIKYSQTTL